MKKVGILTCSSSNVIIIWIGQLCHLKPINVLTNPTSLPYKTAAVVEKSMHHTDNSFENALCINEFHRIMSSVHIVIIIILIELLTGIEPSIAALGRNMEHK